MNKFLSILGVIGAIIGLIIAFLPISNLAIFPAIIGFVLGLIAYYSTKKKNGNISFSRIVILVSLLAIIVSTGKQVFIKNTVEKDAQFIEKTEQSEQDAVKELEELEDELNDDLEE